MAMLPALRGGQNLAVIDPSREFEDIYERTGQLMTIAFGDLGMARLADVPWSPLAHVSETDDAYLDTSSCPGSARTRSTCSCRTGSWSSAARSRRPRTAGGTAARAARPL